VKREPSLAEQVGAVARRSATDAFRQRALLFFPMLFPLILFAINGSALSKATEIPHFPTHSYRAFLLAFPFVQGAMFVSISAGTSLGRDIETGFLNRLALTPVRGSALLVGHLSGVMVLGMIQALFYICFALAVGVRFQTGVAGGFVILALASLIAASFGMFGAFLALRTGSGESIQATFPFLFIFLFISSMNTPRDLIAVHWFKIAATINPVSYLIEGVRSLIITGWDGQALGLAFGIALTIGVCSVGLASWAMKQRMART
jgi:ABC-2 type transport system permease protein